MNKSKNILIALSLLSFVACGSTGGGHDSGNITQISGRNIDENSPLKTGKLTFYTGAGAVKKNQEVVNTGTISSKGVKHTYNDGEIDDIAKGMVSVNDGKIINRGTITGALEDGMYSDGKNSSAINEGEIKDLNGRAKYKEKEVENGQEKIVLRNENLSYGMYAGNGAKIINSKTGKIEGIMSTGMAAYGEGSEATNNGEIKLSETKNYKNGKESNTVSYDGMYIKNGAKGINNGEIDVNGEDNNGMSIGSISKGSENNIPSSILNTGKINIDGNNNNGMEVYDSGEETNSGEININGEYNTGMIKDSISKDSENNIPSSTLNTGKINIDGNNNNGMQVYNSGVATNNGEIRVEGEHNIGMFARGKASKIINGENGVIYLRGTNQDGVEKIVTKTINKIAIEGDSFDNYENSFGTDNHGNVAMKIENGATMINKGKIIFEGK